MIPRFRLEDIDVSSMGSNPVVGTIATIEFPVYAHSSCDCKHEGQGGGVCRSKRNIEEIYRSKGA